MMKRKVVCALLAGAFVSAAAPMTARAAHSSAMPFSSTTAVLQKFYGWYLVQPNHEWTAHFAQIEAAFDPSLYTMLQSVLQSKANQEEPVMDFDPFVNAQWDAVSYALGTPVSQGNEVRIPVTLNPSGRPNPKTTLTVVLRKNASGSYAIFNFIYDPAFNLRDFLHKQLKTRAG
jgi:hypothetical protein